MELLAEKIEEAEKRTRRNEAVSDKNISENLYQLAINIDPVKALNLIRNAQSEEERNFFAYIADMNLQRKQKKAIERNIF